ncbi:MAG: heme ABC exporter ATP-binding protein CcmA [Xanthomonadaceae bacterium]|nr:heme ABC exporter ATP-binding protein CcmA [Xanthomonadaceae bacterium]MDE1958066.1 heme ABC exporter ATP-binding protein CcmA [Xanthomonadaceae bacterium]
MNPRPPPAVATLLEVRELAFARRDEPVFGPLDFDLESGEIGLVEGDNGSGKTTLLRILAGLLHASSGTVRVDGLAAGDPAAAGTALLLGHQLGLKADLSVRENLATAAGLYGRRERCGLDDTLVEVGLEGYADVPVRQLSAGQKKRAALARLRLLPSRLWLLDEPFANLDRAGIALVNRLLDVQVASGGAALVTTHGAVSFRDQATRRIALS